MKTMLFGFIRSVLSRLFRVGRFSQVSRPAESSQPAGPVLDAETQETLLARLTSCRQETLTRLQDAIKETEAETLLSGGSLREIVQEAEQFVEEIKLHLGKLQAHGDSNVSEVLQHQGETVDTFMTDIAGRISEQEDIADRIMQTAESIASEADSVSHVSRQSKLLALNTMVEASRLSAGGAFSVIAEEMHKLSESVTATNGKIIQLAQGLLPILQKSQENVATMRLHAEQFSERLDGQHAQVADVTQKLSVALDESLSSGDTHLANIISQSHSALNHLQFQDPLAQRLLRIDKLLYDLEEAAAADIGYQGQRKVAPIAHFEIGGGEDVTDIESGEVMLFS